MAEKIIQQQSKAGDNLYPVIHADSIPADAVTTEKVKDNSVTEPKLSAELDKKITDSKTVTDTLMEGLKDPDHLEDPFVRAGLIPIPFEDAEVKRILVENYDTDGDGELYYKDVQAIKSLDRGKDMFAGNTKIKKFNELRFFSDNINLHRDSNIIGTFQGCSNLESVELPEGLKEIDYYIFSDCTKLNVDHLPDSITNLGGNLFQNCKALTLTKLPDSLTSMGWYCFSGCVNCEFKETPVGLTVIPEGWANDNKSKTLDILSPNLRQLYWNSCGQFSDWVALHALTPPTCDSYVFNSNATIYVPDEAVDTYKAATGFKDMADRIKPLSEKPATT